MSLELLIEGQAVDIGSPEDIRLSINRELTDLQNPDFRKGEFSYTITLPCTKNNKRIFKKQEPAEIDKFNAVSDFSAELFFKGRQVLVGLFRVRGVNKGNYEGNFYSSSISWADELSKYSLRDLQLTAPFNLAGGVNSLQSYMSLGPEESNILFPLIAYQPFRNTVDTADKFTINANSVFQYKDFPPAVYYINLIKECFRFIGWEAIGDLWQKEDFKKLYLPYTEDEEYIFNFFQLHGVEATGLKSSLNLELIPPYDGFIGPADRLEGNLELTPGGVIGNGIEQLIATDTIIKQTDNNAYNTTAEGEYNITHNNPYNFKISLSNFIAVKDQNNNPTAFEYDRFAIFAIDDNLGSPEKAAAELAINDYLLFNNNEVTNEDVLFFADLATGYSNIEGVSFNRLIEWIVQPSLIGSDIALYSSLSFPTEPLVIETPPINLVEGQKIKFYFATYNRAFAPDNWLTIYVYDTLKIEVNNQFEEEINVAQNLPDISMKDFVSSYINLTNSFFITDGERQLVNFFTFDNLHLSSEQAYFYDKADIKAAVFKPNNSLRELTLAYTVDNKDRLVGGSSFGNRTEFNSNIYSSGSKTIKLPFSSSRLLTAIHSVGPAVSFQIPNIMSEEQFNQGVLLSERQYKGGYEPRLLQAATLLDVGGLINIDVDGEATNILLSSFTGAPPHPTQQGLPFLNLKFEETAGELNNLFEVYYLNYLQLLQRGYLLELQGDLDSKDFREMQIERPIIYNSDTWFLFSIQGFNPLAPEQAKLTLIKRL